MLRVNQFRFYELGQKISAAKFVKGTQFRKKFFELWEAREAVQSLMTHDIPVRVCRPAAERLIAAISVIVPLDWSEALDRARTQGDTELGEYKVYEYDNAVSEFETVLGAECQQLDTYFVSQKVAYSMPDLVERAEMLLPESVRAKVPSHCINDMKAAGRCLAFDNPTAAGFHLARAVESVMAEFYVHVVGKQMPTRMRNWGIYIKQLRASGADAKVVGLLDHIREDYRNPITHPEVTLDSEEIEVLMGVSVSAITRMIHVMQMTPPKLALPPTPKRISGTIGELLKLPAGDLGDSAP